MRLLPRENLLSKREKAGRNLLHLSFILINGLCNWDFCLVVRLLREMC